MMHATGVRAQVLTQPARAHRSVAPQGMVLALQRAALRIPGRTACRAQRRAAKLQRVQAVYGSEWSTPGDAYVTVVGTPHSAYCGWGDGKKHCSRA